MAAEEEPPSLDLELGDSIILEGGQLDGTRGRIYYLDPEHLRILPNGMTNRLIEIPVQEGAFPEELGLTNIYIDQKRATDKFVAQIGAQKDDIVDTFDLDGSPGPIFKVQEINEAEDTIMLVDQTGGVVRIDFVYGIPLEQPFAVLRPRPPPTGFSEEGALVEGEDEEEDPFANVEEPAAEPEPAVTGIVERASSEVFYPDSIQRQDMLRDIFSGLSLQAQKNPKRQREIRKEVEQCMLLRNEVVAYTPAGNPVGQIPTSYQTIGELLDRADIPLARPVLDASRTLYCDLDPDDYNPTEVPGAKVDIRYLYTNLLRENEFLETQLAGSAEELLVPGALPKWFQSWDIFYKNFMRSWISDGEAGDAVVFRGDKEFLRAPLTDGLTEVVDGFPFAFGNELAKKHVEETIRKTQEQMALLEDEPLGAEEVEEEGVERPAAAPKRPINQTLVSAGSVGKTRLSLLKGLGPRSVRVNPKEPPRRIESGDEGVIQNQILFPLSTERDLGLSRSGRLSKDILLSHKAPTPMSKILTNMGGVPTKATAGGLLSVGPGGNTEGNIGLDDWLKVQPLYIKGLGDALVEIKNLGMTQKELTTDQQNVLVDKIRQIHALLKEHIMKERDRTAQAISQLQRSNNTFLTEEALEEFFTIVQEEPILAERLDDLQKKIPAYAKNDIAAFAGLAVELSDLLMTALAAQPALVARERNRRVRDQMLQALHNAMRNARKRELHGEEPEPIKCVHVTDLETIKKEKDHDVRMQLLARFLGRFKKYRKDNWLYCSAAPEKGDHQLMCYHEELLLQEFLKPREKDTIHKELLLSFSGGVFQGHYMCKNCGQPIAELDFDRGMEFDENGNPLAGGGALGPTQEELEEEELKALLGGPIDAEEEIQFDSELRTLIYKVAKLILDKIGIAAEVNDYMRIIQRVEPEIQKQPSQEIYAKLVKAKAAKGEKMLDYDIHISRVLVCATAAHTLIEIQARIPDYIPRYRLPGCRAGFSGFPIGDEKDKTGVEYLACAVAAIQRQENPWDRTGYLKMSDTKRAEAIKGGILQMVEAANKTAVVQILLSIKKAYLEKIYGSRQVSAFSGKLPEQIPPGFKPDPIIVTAEEAAEAPVVANAATPEEATRAWIQSAHRIARANGIYVKETPFSESSCCSTPIMRPNAFWKEKESQLPVLPPKLRPRGQVGSQTLMSFTPRRQARLLADPPEDLFYRVFLRVCFDGPRKGLPHEPGFSNKCIHCGFQFHENPYLMAPKIPLDKSLVKDWVTETSSGIEGGKSALSEQKIRVDKSSFEDLLDATHMNYRVELPERSKPKAGKELLAYLGDITPEPFQGWKSLIAATFERVSRLPPKADTLSVADAYGPLSEFNTTVLGDFAQRLGGDFVRSLITLLEQSPSQIVETVRAYFLVPFQRLLMGFNSDSVMLQRGPAYRLPEDTRQDANKGLQIHLAYLDPLKKLVGFVGTKSTTKRTDGMYAYVQIKLTRARDALSIVLPILQKEVRAALVPGAAGGLPHIVKAMILGILSDLINPNVYPEGVLPRGAGGAVDSTARVPLKILETCLDRLQKEGLNFTEQQIRDMIEKRNEAEKVLYINRFQLPTREKRLALRIKNLGLNEWAIGGTKGIYALDKDVVEMERSQRVAMGLPDFAETMGGAAEYAAMVAEAYGGGPEGGGGYDVGDMED